MIIIRPPKSWAPAFLGAGALIVALPAAAAETGRFLWSVTPYIWAADTSYDLTADGAPIGGGNISFSDLLDVTDASFQIAVETGRDGGQWSGFVDLTYLDTSDDLTVNVGGTDVRIDTDSEQWFIDAALAWWPGGEADGLNLFGGIRYTDLDDRYDFSVASTGDRLGTLDNERDFTDALLGVRYRFDIVTHWSLQTRADYAFGDSDGIFLIQALFRYAVGKTRANGIMFGYRYKEAELGGGGLEEDYEYKGPVAAFNFRF